MPDDQLDKVLRCAACGKRFRLTAGAREAARCPGCGGSLATDLPRKGAVPEAPPDPHAPTVAAEGVVGTPSGGEGSLRLVRGARLGSYILLNRLGQGGMGWVFRARQIGLKREVALKVLPPELLSRPDLVRRFEREAQASADLDHPGIVKVYEFGKTGSWHWFSMELVGGRPLDAWIDAEEPSRERLLEVLEMIARAVNAAHRKGVIHRDLKPSNVMIDVEGRPRVLDFGLAKLTGDSALGGGTNFTVTGQVFGTPQYMAPEQAEGRTRDVDVRSDVFALGVIAYEAFTGSLPFQGGNVTKLLREISETDPEPLTRIATGIGRDLETVVLKCLEKDPDRRYAGAGELAEDLRRLRVGEPISARAPSAWYLFRKAVARHRAVAVTVAAALILLIGTGIYSFIRIRKELTAKTGALREARSARGIAEEARLAAEISERNAIQSAEDLRRQLAVFERLREARKLEEQGAAPEIIESAYAEAIAIDPEDFRIHHQRGVWNLQRAAYAEAERDFTEALRLEPGHVASLARRAFSRTVGTGDISREEVVRDLQAVLRSAPGSLEGVMAEGLLAFLEGNQDEAERVLADGIGKYRSAFLHITRGYFYKESGDLMAAERDYARALVLDPGLAMAWNNLGWIRLETGRPSDAMTCFDEAIRLRPDFGSAWAFRARALDASGRSAESIASWDRAIDLSPEDPLYRSSRGWLRFRLERFEEAEIDYQQCLRLDPENVASHSALALVRLRRGDREGAVAYANRALDIDSSYAPGYIVLAQIRIASGDHAGAVIASERALELAPDSSSGLAQHGLALLLTGRLEEAESVLSRALDLDSGLYEVWSNRGVVRIRLGRYADAVNDLTEALRLDPDSTGAYVSRAGAYYHLSRFDEAMADLERAFRINPALREDPAVQRTIERVREASGLADGPPE